MFLTLMVLWRLILVSFWAYGLWIKNGPAQWAHQIGGVWLLFDGETHVVSSIMNCNSIHGREMTWTFWDSGGAVRPTTGQFQVFEHLIATIIYIIYIYTYIHTYIRTYVRTYIYTYIHTYYICKSNLTQFGKIAMVNNHFHTSKIYTESSPQSQTCTFLRNSRGHPCTAPAGTLPHEFPANFPINQPVWSQVESSLALPELRNTIWLVSCSFPKITEPENVRDLLSKSQFCCSPMQNSCWFVNLYFAFFGQTIFCIWGINRGKASRVISYCVSNLKNLSETKVHYFI